MRPDVDIQIQCTGVRPGEKLFEELLTAEEGTIASKHEKIFVARRTGLPANGQIDTLVEKLFTASADRRADEIRDILKKIIPTYEPNGKPANVQVNPAIVRGSRSVNA